MKSKTEEKINKNKNKRNNTAADNTRGSSNNNKNDNNREKGAKHMFFQVYNSMVCGIQTRVLPIRYDMIIRCVLSVGDVYFFHLLSFFSFHFLHFIFNTVRSSSTAFVSCASGTLILLLLSLSLYPSFSWSICVFYFFSFDLFCLPFKSFILFLCVATESGIFT